MNIEARDCIYSAAFISGKLSNCSCVKDRRQIDKKRIVSNTHENLDVSKLINAVLRKHGIVWSGFRANVWRRYNVTAADDSAGVSSDFCESKTLFQPKRTREISQDLIRCLHSSVERKTIDDVVLTNITQSIDDVDVVYAVIVKSVEVRTGGGLLQRDKVGDDGDFVSGLSGLTKA